MKSYACEIPSTRLHSAVRKPKIAEFSASGSGADVECERQSLRLHGGNPYRRQLFRHLLATALLGMITVVFWLSLIGLAPSVYARGTARTSPAQSTLATTSSGTEIKGRQQI